MSHLDLLDPSDELYELRLADEMRSIAEDHDADVHELPAYSTGVVCPHCEHLQACPCDGSTAQPLNGSTKQ